MLTTQTQLCASSIRGSARIVAATRVTQLSWNRCAEWRQQLHYFSSGHGQRLSKRGCGRGISRHCTGAWPRNAYRSSMEVSAAAALMVVWCTPTNHRYRNGSQRGSKLIDAVVSGTSTASRKLISALGLTFGGLDGQRNAPSNQRLWHCTHRSAFRVAAGQSKCSPEPTDRGIPRRPSQAGRGRLSI
jgi:hypothetical protein